MSPSDKEEVLGGRSARVETGRDPPMSHSLSRSMIESYFFSGSPKAAEASEVEYEAAWPSLVK